MEKIKIIFLGTGFAIPTKDRNHSAILVSFGKENILVDCGEGTQRQFKIAGLSMMKLTKILITHWHGDHVIGLIGLLESLALQGYNKPLTIYGPKGTKYFMEIIGRLTGIHNIYKLKYEVEEVSGKFFEEKDFFIEAAPMKHRIPANAYSIVFKSKTRLDRNKLKKLKIPNSPLMKQLAEGKDIIINGKKIKASAVAYKEKGRKISFVLDTVYNEDAVRLAKNSDLLIAEASFLKKDEEKARAYWHMTVEEAAKLAKNSGSKELILTHISERYKTCLNELEKEAKKIFKNTKLAKDFMRLEI